MHANVHDNRYYCWYDTGTERGVLILEIDANGVTLTRSDIYATASFSDGRRDELFVALPADNDVHKWNAGEALLGTWVGRQMILERPQNVGAVQVVADAYPVVFTLTAMVETDDGPRTVTVAKEIQNGRPTRLRGNYRARSYTYKVQAATKVREVTIASTLGNITAV